MRRKLVDIESVKRWSVGQLAAYLNMPIETYTSARRMEALFKMPYATLLHYLKRWEEIGLVERLKYDGNDLKTRYQYRMLFNRITVTRSGVLFELVREG